MSNDEEKDEAPASEPGPTSEPAPTSEAEPAAEPTPTPRPAGTTDDWGWPAFAVAFPEHPALQALTVAFSLGDYKVVREGAAKLLADDAIPADVKAAARVLRSRTEPDPTARVFFVLAAALLAFLSIYWLTHDGPEHMDAPAPASFPQVEHVK